MSVTTKLAEFVAHGGNVTCSVLGRKTARLLATGGDDKSVNVWNIGNPNPLLSITYSTSPIEAIQFDNNEEIVVAGSASGTLRVCDLQLGKVVRTLTGHTAGVRCIDFHPYGEIIASGSQDTSLKIWDVRKKDCIQSYKGHTNVVNCARFSPDGRWVVSGSDDNTIKLWDMSACKMLHEFSLHTGPVTSIEFHPSELLLASGSADRTVMLWDLERFDPIMTTAPEASRVRALAFHPAGRSVFSGATDSLRVYGWEPDLCLDSLSIGWGKVADMCMRDDNNTLVGASFSQSVVRVYSVDLSLVKLEQGATVARDITTASRNPSSSSEAKPKQGVESAREGKVVSLPDINKTKQAVERQRPPTTSNNKKANDDAPRRYTPPPEPIPSADILKPKLENNVKSSDKGSKAQGLSFDAFLQAESKNQLDSTGKSEEELLLLSKSGHKEMMTVLSTRMRNMRLVKTLWEQGKHKQAIESALDLRDDAILVDILNVIAVKPSVWTLDVVVLLLASGRLDGLLKSVYESYASCSCDVVQLVAKTFGQTILNNVQAPPSKGAIDISREERFKKCSEAYDAINALRPVLQGRAKEHGKVGSVCKKTLQVIDQIM